MNKVMIIGNVGKDPVCRTLQDGGKVANFSIAASERWKDKATGEQKEKTEWVNVSVWGPLAGVVENYVKKGTKVYVCGKFQTRKWTDQAGNDKYTTEVVLQGFGAELELLSSKPSAGGEQGDAYEPEQQQRSAAAASKPRGYQPPLDDEIPF